MSRALAAEIELSARRAWPAIESEVYDGWELRFSNGFTRRANSVQPVGRSQIPIEAKLDDLERRYAQLGRPLVFRLTEFAEPGIDGSLARRGYSQTARVVTMARPVSPALPSSDVMFTDAPSPAWLEARLVWSGLSASRAGDLREIVERIEHAGFATLHEATTSGLVAVGLGVVDGRHVGLFGLATHPDRRRRGHGSRLVGALLAWGSERNAEIAYLQVAEANGVARALYGRLGFSPLYEYWYRERL